MLIFRSSLLQATRGENPYLYRPKVLSWYYQVNFDKMEVHGGALEGSFSSFGLNYMQQLFNFVIPGKVVNNAYFLKSKSSFVCCDSQLFPALTQYRGTLDMLCVCCF